MSNAKLDILIDETYKAHMGNHADALLAVYNAGKRHEEYVIEQRHILEDQQYAAEQSRIAAVNSGIEQERFADAAAGNLPVDQADRKALEADRAAEIAAVTSERSGASSNLKFEHIARHAKRMEALRATDPARKDKTDQARKNTGRDGRPSVYTSGSAGSNTGETNPQGGETSLDRSNAQARAIVHAPDGTPSSTPAVV